MTATRKSRRGLVWLELVVAFAFIALLLQFFPTLPKRTLRAADLRHWSQLKWFITTLAIVVFLVSVRFRPEFIASVQGLRARRHAMAVKRQNLKKVQQVKIKAEQERILYARMKEARKHQA